jgi:hypothetical protein
MRHKNLLALTIILTVVLCAATLMICVKSTPSSTEAPERVTTDTIGPRYLYPDPKRTPGAISPKINQANIETTICAPGWSTKSLRPPSSYTTALKRKQIREFGLMGETHDYEEDHLIPLELGGDPTDAKNLWPQRYGSPGAREKDGVENYLHHQVCSGAISLAEAQQMIVSDWFKVYLSVRQPSGSNGEPARDQEIN